MVGCCKLSLYANESCDEHAMTFSIPGNDIISLESTPLNFRVFIYAYSPRTADVFPVVAFLSSTNFWRERSDYRSLTRVLDFVELIASSFLDVISKQVRPECRCKRVLVNHNFISGIRFSYRQCRADFNKPLSHRLR